MPWREPVKFLLVDDRPENLRALEALLRRDGLSIHQATSGNEALELLLQHDYSLALLDVQMPDMDGFELAELMRGPERTRNVPIIFITAAEADEGRRFRGYEAGAVDYVFKPLDPLVVRSKAKVFFDLGQQRQELARQRNELQKSAAELSTALHRIQAHADNSPLGIVEFDPDLRLLSWSKGAERMFGWSDREVVGQHLRELGWVPDSELGDLLADLEKAMTDREHKRGLYTVGLSRKYGEPLFCEWYSSVLRDGNGRPVSLSVQILDVTERRKAAETQRLLIGELNHRVKNTLATVQAIATQTLRHTLNPEHFSQTFSGRIQSLARAHAMLSAATWQGAQLEELIRDQLRLGTIDEARLSLSGPVVELEPQVALRLALVFHELFTNAIKYGALSSDTGRVDLKWTTEAEQLSISWTESGGPKVKTPTRRGFGATLIEQSIKADGGTATASYRTDGLVWSLSLVLPRTDSSEIRKALSMENSFVSPSQAGATQGSIEGRTYLVVEDEALVGLELMSILEDFRAEALGPATTVEDALVRIDRGGFDGAFLDGNLQGRTVGEVAAALTQRNIPFVFVSGYGRENLPLGFGNTPIVSKPFTPQEILDAAEAMTKRDRKVVRLRS